MLKIQFYDDLLNQLFLFSTGSPIKTVNIWYVLVLIYVLSNDNTFINSSQIKKSQTLSFISIVYVINPDLGFKLLLQAKN